MSSPAPNFLTCPSAPELPAPSTESAPRLPAPKTHRKKWLYILAGCFLLLLFLPLVFGGAVLGTHAYFLRNQLRQAQTQIQKGNLIDAQNTLRHAQDSLDGVGKGLTITWFWRSLPVTGSPLRALERTKTAGNLTLQAVNSLVSVGATIEQAIQAKDDLSSTISTSVSTHRSFQDLSVEEKRLVLARLNEQLTQARVARDKIAIALEAWQRVPLQDLPSSLRPTLASAVLRLTQVRQGLDEVIPLAQIFVPLAGYPQERTYLVLLQNADELRPTGGFIGVIGLLTVEAGEIKQFHFQDVYAIDGPVLSIWKDVPPEPLRRYLGVNAWFFRDSNWSPDFPQSAERLMDVYERQRSTIGLRPDKIDGVIALEPAFFEHLLRITGPVQVEGKTFTADNFFTQLQYDVEIGFRSDRIPVAQRKEVVAKVGQAVMKKLVEQPAERWPALLDFFVKRLDEKDMLVYVRDAQTLGWLDDRFWTGRTRAQEPLSDYLWIVDANLAAFKTDGVMEKNVIYQLEATDSAQTIARVTLRYHNTNRQVNWRYTRYRDYVRLYVPEGSELVSVQGAMADDLLQTGGQLVPGTVDVTRDLGKTVFGTFWAIEPGETRELIFRYRLPSSVAERLQQGSYELLVQKQPGSHVSLTLDHSFGKNLHTAEPPEERKDFGDHLYRLHLPLNRDQRFQVQF